MTTTDELIQRAREISANHNDLDFGPWSSEAADLLRQLADELERSEATLAAGIRMGEILVTYAPTAELVQLRKERDEARRERDRLASHFDTCEECADCYAECHASRPTEFRAAQDELQSLRLANHRMRAALENIAHNTAYDMSKANTNHDRERFEIVWNRARKALAGEGGDDV